MVLDPIPQSLFVHFFGSWPQPPTSRAMPCRLHVKGSIHTLHVKGLIYCSRDSFVDTTWLKCVAVRCSVLQCGAVCCSAVQCVAVRCSVLQCGAVSCSAVQCVAVRCSVLQFLACDSTLAWHDSSVLQWVVVRCSVLRALPPWHGMTQVCCSGL